MNKLGFFYVLLFLISFSTFSQNDSLKESQKYHVKILILNQHIDSANNVLEDFKNTYNYLTEDSIFYAYQKVIINRESGNYESATNRLQEILKFYEQTGNIEKQLETIVDLAITYDHSGNHDISKYWNKIGIEKLNNKYNPKTHVQFLMNIANNYTVCMEDSALFYYQKAIDVASKNNIPTILLLYTILEQFTIN